MSKLTYLLETEMYFEAVDESLPLSIEVEIKESGDGEFEFTPTEVMIEGVKAAGFENNPIIKKIVDQTLDSELCADMFYEEKYSVE